MAFCHLYFSTFTHQTCRYHHTKSKLNPMLMISILSPHTKKIKEAENRLQPYLNDIFNWTQDNDLQLNADKSTATLFTPDPAEYHNTLSLTINNKIIPTVKNPKFLGLHLDPQLTFNRHIEQTKEKASKTINMLKALTTQKMRKR